MCANGTLVPARHVRYASNSDPIGASQRNDVMCHKRLRPGYSVTSSKRPGIRDFAERALRNIGSGYRISPP